MIHSICGMQNSGKTLYMSLLAYIDYKNGYKIFSNYELFFPHYRINKDFITYLAIKQPQLINVSLALDEFWLWYDSRRAMTIDNLLGTYLFLQTSKNNVNVRITAQTNQQNESRIRDNAQRYTSCKRIIIDNKTFIEPRDDTRDLGEPYNSKLLIVARNYKKKGDVNLSWYEPYENKFLVAKPLFKLFNTYEKKVILI